MMIMSSHNMKINKYDHQATIYTIIDTHYKLHIGNKNKYLAFPGSI